MGVGRAIEKMIVFSDGHMNDITHLLKVYAYAKAIGECEQLDVATQETLELAAVVHDIACPLCRKKYGSTDAKWQEKEGGALARHLLEEIGYKEEVVSRVSYLVAHHHTYTGVDGLDYQILLEADYLVNANEKNLSADSIRAAMASFFKTKTGIHLLESMYLR